MATQQENQHSESGNTTTLKQEEQLPHLYSKKLILVFSILFSTIFAAALMMSNLRAVGKEKARIQVLLFAFLYLLLTATVLQVFELPPNLTFIANVIGAAILNEYFWNNHMGRDLEYHKKGWLKPAGISLGIALIFFFLLLSL